MHNRFFVIRRVTASCATCGGTISTLINEMFAPRVGHSKGTSKTATAPFGSAAPVSYTHLTLPTIRSV